MASAANTLTVWLQVDAQSGWPEVVAAANAQFKAQNPGWDVDVQYQTWGTHLAKFDATLAGGNAPDVIEMGNTEMTKYMAAGAFQDLTGELVPEQEHVAPGPRRVGALRRQDLRRPVLRRIAGRHLPHRPVQAGRTRRSRRASPSSSRWREEARREEQAKTFSPVYIAGTDWYVAMSFVYDYGGKIAITQQGQVGRHARQAGGARRAGRIQALLRRRFARQQDDGRGAALPVRRLRPGQRRVDVGPGWFSCCVGDYKNRTAQFVMPSHTKGQPIPGFLGGSDLAVPVGANKAQAAAWISAFTDNASMTALRAKGNIPNTTSLLGNSVNERAARRSWFVPTAKNWVNVENGNVLRTMLPRILTGKSSHQGRRARRERQHHVHPEPVGSRRDDGRRRGHCPPVSAATASLRPRAARRRFRTC